jgi:hypothetical protein
MKSKRQKKYVRCQPAYTDVAFCGAAWQNRAKARHATD